jgi:hypothetical protein
MMIAVAVAASLVTYAWVMGYLSFTTNKVGKAIQIQSIGLTTAGNNMTIYVQNVGDSAVTLTDNECVYVDGLQFRSSGATTLQKGDTATLVTVKTIILPDLHPYTVKVVTEDGTFTEATKTFG